ncbi:MAG: hypothetical protein DWI24_07885 [Planctomycetota bacterium]|nr:MAG: hypothetical protein DWI24_07885 [Planctomycetota bacterium]
MIKADSSSQLALWHDLPEQTKAGPVGGVNFYEIMVSHDLRYSVQTKFPILWMSGFMANWHE